MECLFYNDISLFAFPINLIGGLLLVVGIWILHRYNPESPIVHGLTSMPVILSVCGLLILILVIEGIWALHLFKTWIFISLLLFLLIILELVILKKLSLSSGRNILFLLNHGGLWLVLISALLGAPDRKEYKIIVPLGEKEYYAVDRQGVLHLLPFTIRLDKFELQYYPETENAHIPKRFCSTMTIESRSQTKQVSVEVNAPAHFEGYTLYQDGYDTKAGNASQYTILLVVRDPWIYPVYAGIFLLLLGAGLVFLRRKYAWLLLAGGFMVVNLITSPMHNHTQMPALQSIWFIPHVTVYMFSYALMGCALIFSLSGNISRFRSQRPQIVGIADNLVHTGTALLTTGMLLGAIWAKQAWGHYWSWDPKETWAALTWLSYICYLHVRYRYPSQYRSATVMLTLSFLFLQICWYGINYLPAAIKSIHIYHVE